MPDLARKTTDRVMVACRVGAAGLRWVDVMALEATTTRSHVIRTALRFARANEREFRTMLRSR